MIEVFDCAQGSDEWLRCRLGLPTASNFSDVLAKGKGAAESLTRARYLRTLAAEIITGEPGESFTTPAIERGKAMEAEARNLYAFANDISPQLVGFIKNGPKGCSPDALIGDDAMLEIKTKRGDILIEVLMRDTLPPEHIPQVQGSLWVAEREWLDFVAYWPGLPLFIKRCYRDDNFIATLAAEVARFNDDLAEIVERVRRYGMPLRDQLSQTLALLPADMETLAR